jgi:hydrogenase-1 operon protein HyaF
MSKPVLIPTADISHARPNPLAWEGEEQAEGVFLGSTVDDQLALLGTPSMVLPAAPRLPDDFSPNPALRDWLAQLVAGLDQLAAQGQAHTLPSLCDLDAESGQAIAEILGKGEVDGNVSLDGVAYQMQEAVLAGVWQMRGDDGSHWVEVGPVPQLVNQAANSLQLAAYPIPRPEAELMNAPAVLSEIRERALNWQGGDNHVINFTLLPMSPQDHELLCGVLGRAELVLNSGGFGQCRVMATTVRHVWAVQYINAMGHTILDTIEIGGIPTAVSAAREDFEDSAVRLGEILEAYL